MVTYFSLLERVLMYLPRVVHLTFWSIDVSFETFWSLDVNYAWYLVWCNVFFLIVVWCNVKADLSVKNLKNYWKHAHKSQSIRCKKKVTSIRKYGLVIFNKAWSVWRPSPVSRKENNGPKILGRGPACSKIAKLGPTRPPLGSGEPHPRKRIS